MLQFMQQNSAAVLAYSKIELLGEGESNLTGKDTGGSLFAVYPFYGTPFVCWS